MDETSLFGMGLFRPNIYQLQDRQGEFLAPGGVHLLPNDGSDLL
jgi:hypothetical protein